MGCLASAFGLSGAVLSAILSGFTSRVSHLDSDCDVVNHNQPETQVYPPFYYFLFCSIGLACLAVSGLWTQAKAPELGQDDCQEDYIPLATLEPTGNHSDSEPPKIPSRLPSSSREVDIYGRLLLREPSFWLLFFAMAVEDGYTLGPLLLLTLHLGLL